MLCLGFLAESILFEGSAATSVVLICEPVAHNTRTATEHSKTGGAYDLTRERSASLMPSLCKGGWLRSSREGC